MHGLGDLLPALDLFRRMNARRSGLPRPVGVTCEASAMISPPGVARWA